jgi:hypothetical protein
LRASSRTPPRMVKNKHVLDLNSVISEWDLMWLYKEANNPINQSIRTLSLVTQHPITLHWYGF